MLKPTLKEFLAIRNYLWSNEEGVPYWMHSVCSWCKGGADEDGGTVIGICADYLGVELEEFENAHIFTIEPFIMSPFVLAATLEKEYICQECLNVVQESRRHPIISRLKRLRKPNTPVKNMYRAFVGATLKIEGR